MVRSAILVGTVFLASIGFAACGGTEDGPAALAGKGDLAELAARHCQQTARTECAQRCLGDATGQCYSHCAKENGCWCELVGEAQCRASTLIDYSGCMLRNQCQPTDADPLLSPTY